MEVYELSEPNHIPSVVLGPFYTVDAKVAENWPFFTLVHPENCGVSSGVGECPCEVVRREAKLAEAFLVAALEAEHNLTVCHCGGRDPKCDWLRYREQFLDHAISSESVAKGYRPRRVEEVQ